MSIEPPPRPSLRTLTELVRSISAAQTEDRVLAAVTETFQRVFGYERVSILLVEEGGRTVLRTLSGDFGPEVQPGLALDGGQGLVGRAIRRGGLVHAPDTGLDADYHGVEGLETGSELAAPIRIGDRTVAVIDVQSRRKHAFSAEDEDVVRSVADLVGVALERVGLLERLRRQKRAAENALSRSRELEETKDRFLSAVSHEFRTPLTSIRSFSEILLTHVQEEPETTREFISIIHDESIRLTRLVTDLLDLSKIQAGRMEWDFRVNDLTDAIRRAAKSVASLARQKELEIEVTADDGIEPFIFDRDKVIQVLVNLLSNAIKFSPEGQPVRIHAGPSEGGARVSVRDCGPGVPEEHREHIFERFRQVGSSRKKVQGTGLGLSISLEIVSAHGGSIWVDESPEGGSDFVFTLPARPPGEHSGSTRGPEEARDPGSRLGAEPGGATSAEILVIDDDENFRRYLSYELERAGFAFTMAEDSPTGLHLARTRLPALVLLDLRMPILTGRDVLTLFAGDPATAEIPVLVLSVAPEEECRDLPGARHFLRKPVKSDELLTWVRKLL